MSADEDDLAKVIRKYLAAQEAETRRQHAQRQRAHSLLANTVRNTIAEWEATNSGRIQQIGIVLAEIELKNAGKTDTTGAFLSVVASQSKSRTERKRFPALTMTLQHDGSIEVECKGSDGKPVDGFKAKTWKPDDVPERAAIDKLMAAYLAAVLQIE